MASRHFHTVVRFFFNAVLFLPAAVILIQPVHASNEEDTRFRSVPTQFIAALGDPGANAGYGARSWSIWTVGPGPRGVTRSCAFRYRQVANRDRETMSRYRRPTGEILALIDPYDNKKNEIKKMSELLTQHGITTVETTRPVRRRAV